MLFIDLRIWMLYLCVYIKFFSGKPLLNHNLCFTATVTFLEQIESQRSRK